MITPYPSIDHRRAKKLVAELERLAAVFVPALRGVTEADSSSRALVEIAGRLAGQVTQRMDKVPRRDAIAFFHALDVPQQPPRSANAPLIFTLSEKRDKPVIVPARVQVAAKTPDGEQVIFETNDVLKITPARLDFVAAVDANKDYIEEPPPQFFQLAPANLEIPYKVLTMAIAGSNMLQVSPAVGLEPNDVIGIDTQVYRVKEAKDGLVTLHENDSLEQDVEADTDVRKVTRFDAFQLRNLQQHVVYIGHTDLLNLEQPSTIHLNISPANFAARLAILRITIELYGINDEDIESEPRWQPIILNNLVGGALTLSKDWIGAVEEVEIHGQKSRWLRIKLDNSTGDTPIIDARIDNFTLQVESKHSNQRDIENEGIEIQAVVQNQTISNTIKLAFHNNIPLSLAESFAPFGEEPLRFDTFAFAAPEALTKKGAIVVLTMSLERVNLNAIDTDIEPRLSWEYFNGDGWVSLDKDFEDTSEHLTEDNDSYIKFRVPDDLAPTEVSGQKNHWIRARLVSGDYGSTQYILETEPGIEPDPDPGPGPVAVFVTNLEDGSSKTKQSITIDKSEIKAPLIKSIEASFEFDANQTISPQQILTENNRAVLDQTQANDTTAAQFEIFESATSIDDKLKPDEQGRALYLGFTKSYDINPLTLYIDADEPVDPGDELKTFELLFEVLESDQQWRKVAVEDKTDGFQHRGVINLFIDITPQFARLFGRDQFWMRIRPKKIGEQWAPLLNGIYINSADAKQAKSVQQEILGASTGEQDQRFFISKIPVISDSLEIRVRETLSEDERLDLEQASKDRHDSRSQESARTLKPVITTYPDIPGSWVLWQQIESFVEQDSDARIYQLDPASGVVRFGNDRQGKIPPAGSDAVRAIEYQNGGGEQGNLPAFTIEELKSSVESVDNVTNPIPATGGVDILDVDSLISTAPDRLRHRQQALTTVDIEALAIAWSSEIVRARCFMPEQPGDSILVFIARRTDERCPKASVAERDALARYLREQGWGALGERSIRVLNPDYVHLSVTVDIIAKSAEKVAGVEKNAREILLKFLHPIDGGPDGSGWSFGRRVWKSDLFRALANISGLDRVDNIDLKPKSLDKLSSSSLICANEEKIRVNVKLNSRESLS